MTALEVKCNHVAEALDDLADLCEHWKRNREHGRMPVAIRAALLMSMRETLAMHDAEAAPQASGPRAAQLGANDMRPNLRIPSAQDAVMREWAQGYKAGKTRARHEVLAVGVALYFIVALIGRLLRA